jgi:hypothetical protein
MSSHNKDIKKLLGNFRLRPISSTSYLLRRCVVAEKRPDGHGPSSLAMTAVKVYAKSFLLPVIAERSEVIQPNVNLVLTLAG